MSDTNGHIPALLFELGTVQVFHYPSLKAKPDAGIVTSAYWQDTATRVSFGPFPSIHAAMMHLSAYIKQQRQAQERPTNIIVVDFKAKKRIIPNV